MAQNDVTRRTFIQGTAAAAALAAGGRAGAESGGEAIAIPHATLGRTGESVSRLGIGCGHFRREHVTPEVVRDIVLRGLEMDINYLDAAPNYGDAEEKLGHVIPDVRDEVFLVTKTEEPSYEGTWALMRQSMERMKTDRLDLVHLHNIGLGQRFEDMKFVFSDKGAMGALREAKRDGVIRYIGATGHVWPSRFHEVLDSGEIDVVMNSVNYIVQHNYDFENKVWSRAREENIGLVAMKVLGGAHGGSGYKIPEDRYEQAIRYALDLPDCACAVIGFESVAELEQAARAVANYAPLSEKESLELSMAGLKASRTPDWTACYGSPVA